MSQRSEGGRGQPYLGHCPKFSRFSILMPPLSVSDATRQQPGCKRPRRHKSGQHMSQQQMSGRPFVNIEQIYILLEFQGPKGPLKFQLTQRDCPLCSHFFSMVYVFCFTDNVLLILTNNVSPRRTFYTLTFFSVYLILP